MLQETILGLALFYKNYSDIYFPVRLDQRGRLYCNPSFLNYQSNELSKALLLFSNPGVLHKIDMSSIKYLKVYRANCYGGTLSKSSISSKIQWVDNHLEDIVNYDNDILLSKAKDKLLFLSFCIEFKRFYKTFYNTILKFHIHLPIQLNATCNGFQHMALLSNEGTLLKKLNLISSNKDKKDSYNYNPHDFYSFLLYKILDYLEDKLNKGEFNDKKRR